MSDKILCPISKLIKNLEINAAKNNSESIAEVKNRKLHDFIAAKETLILISFIHQGESLTHTAAKASIEMII